MGNTHTDPANRGGGTMIEILLVVVRALVGTVGWGVVVGGFEPPSGQPGVRAATPTAAGTAPVLASGKP